MPFFNDNSADALRDGIANAVTHIGLHSRYSIVGGSEIGGGSYVRKAITWESTATGISNNAGITFDTPPGSRVEYFGLWASAASASAVYFKGMIPVDIKSISPGTSGATSHHAPDIADAGLFVSAYGMGSAGPIGHLDGSQLAAKELFLDSGALNTFAFEETIGGADVAVLGYPQTFAVVEHGVGFYGDTTSWTIAANSLEIDILNSRVA